MEHLIRREEIWAELAERARKAEMGGEQIATHPTDAMGRQKTPQQDKKFAATVASLTGDHKSHH